MALGAFRARRFYCSYRISCWNDYCCSSNILLAIFRGDFFFGSVCCVVLSWTTVWRIIFSLCIINKRETSPKNKSYIRYVQCSRLSFYLSLSLSRSLWNHSHKMWCVLYFSTRIHEQKPIFCYFPPNHFRFACCAVVSAHKLSVCMDGWIWFHMDWVRVYLCCVVLFAIAAVAAAAAGSCQRPCMCIPIRWLSVALFHCRMRASHETVCATIIVCVSFSVPFSEYTDWHCEIFRGRRIYTHRFCCCCKEQWCENKHSQMQSAVYCLVKRLRISMAMKWSMNLHYIWWFRIICSSNRAHFNYGTTFGHFSMWCTQIEAFSPFIPLIWLLYTDNSVEQASWICWILPMKAKNNWQFSYFMGEIENLREKFVISKQNWAIPIKIRVFCLKYSNNFEEFEEKWENKMRKRSSLNKNSKNYSKQKHSIGLNV